MKCPYCNADLPDGSNFCSACGSRQGQPQQQVPPPQQQIPPQQQVPPPQQQVPPPQQQVPPPPQQIPPQQYVQAPADQKSRTVYRLLAFFLGNLGIHNFYAGYTTHGIIQLVLSLTGVFAIVSCIWALVEIFIVDKDARGVPMKPGGCGCLLLAMLVPFGAVLLAGLLLPALGGARERARRSSCVSNLKQIGLAVDMFANDNKGHFPRDMKELVDKKYLTDPVVYICPSSSKTPGHATSFVSSYIYLGRGLNGYGPDIPIAMDTPDTHRRYINILYLNGLVRGHELPREMTSCVEIINEVHPDIAKYKVGRIVLENAKEADRNLQKQ